MSSFNKTAGALVALSLLVGGCGFQPMYGSAAVGGHEAAEKLATVEIANIPDRVGQKLRNALIDRMHPRGMGAARYRLEVGLVANDQKLAISKDSSTERVQLVVRAPYRIIDLATGKQVMAATARTNIVYDFLEEQYAMLVSRDNAYDRAIGEISETISNRVAAALGRSS